MIDVAATFGARAQHLTQLLAAGGAQVWFVGGCVRNALMGLPGTDIDLTTDATPDQVTALVTAAGLRAVPTGIAHGTVTVVIDGQPFEVTTLRRDVTTDGRRATVAFTDRVEEDAARRDFTMNALYATPDGTVLDPIGGLPDLTARIIRFIGDPEARIAEDYLRILRFFRFHAAYGPGGHPDAEGLAACIAGRDGLDQLSRERVRQEMMKLLVAAHAVPTLVVMADAGLALRILGGVTYLASFVNVTKSEAAIGAKPCPVRRIGALAVSVAEDAVRLFERLRLTNNEHARLVSMAEGWRRISPVVGEGGARALIYRLGPEAFTDHALLGWARSQASAHDADWLELATLPQRFTAPVFPLKAADFIKRGVAKGPDMGVALRAAEAAWIAQGFPASASALDEIADTAIASSQSS